MGNFVYTSLVFRRQVRSYVALRSWSELRERSSALQQRIYRGRNAANVGVAISL